MANRSYSYAEKINDTKVMLAGLNAQAERVGKRGITAEFITRLQTINEEAKTLDNEQEANKARLKEITKSLDEKMKEQDVLYREAKKAVKLEMEKESWKEFGIKDKQ